MLVSKKLFGKVPHFALAAAFLSGVSTACLASGGEEETNSTSTTVTFNSHTQPPLDEAAANALIEIKINNLTYGMYGYGQDLDQARNFIEERVAIGNAEAIDRKIDGLALEQFNTRQ